jgi:hypothetical protein
MTTNKLMAFFLAALLASSMLAAFEGGAYECHTDTDTECEAEQARKCLFLCN